MLTGAAHHDLLPSPELSTPLRPGTYRLFKEKLLSSAELIARSNWDCPTVQLPEQLRQLLPDTSLEHLVKVNLLRIDFGRILWNFQPVIGNGLVLFKDLRCRRFDPAYVWLRSNAQSKSWSFANQFRLDAHERLLDLGCGTGLNALQAATGCTSVKGIDINPRAVTLAQFNAAFNNITNADFEVASLRGYSCSDFDVAVSQPPFDPQFSISNRILAFSGGGADGLNLTRNIILNPELRSGQRLFLYVHSFASGDNLVLKELLDGTGHLNYCYTIDETKQYSLAKWWAGYCQRYSLAAKTAIPHNLRQYDRIAACFVDISIR